MSTRVKLCRYIYLSRFLSPSVDVLSRHHVAVALLLQTGVDGPPVAALVRVVGLHHVGRVDDDVGVRVRRVHPVTSEVGRQVTQRGDRL